MTFDPMRGPGAIAQGNDGDVTLAGLRVGLLSSWRVVTSPTTGKPTLMGEGRFKRYYTQAVGIRVRAELTPAPRPYRIGRPKPPKASPFTLTGKLYELTARTIVISEGEIT